MKKIFRWLKSGTHHKYINGGKGVISIFLAAIMLPFLTLANYLVESARYHDAVAVLNGAMDSAALSTLSHYDSYLMDRFGLAAVSQKKNIKSTYELYLKDNLKSYASWDVKNVKVTGELKLSDTEILKQEIAEISKFSAPTALAGDFLISELISMLESLKGVKIFNKWSDVLDSAGKTVDATLTLKDSLSAFKKTAGTLKTAIETYEKDYVEFERAVSDLSAAVQRFNEAQASGEEEDGEQEKEDENEALIRAVESAKQELDTKKEKYRRAIEALKQALAAYKTDAEKVRGSLQGIQSSAMSTALSLADASQYGMGEDKKALEDGKKKLENEIKNATGEERERLENQKHDLEIQIEECNNSISNMDTSGNAIYNAANQSLNAIASRMSAYQESKINYVISRLDQFRINLEALHADLVTENYAYYSGDYYEQIQVLVDEASVQGMIQALESQVTEETKGGGSIWGIINAMSTVFRSLFSVNGVFDSRLDAYLQLNLEGYEESAIDRILQDISDLMNIVKDSGGILGAFKILIQLGKIIKIFIRLITHIIAYIGELLTNVFALIKELVNGDAGDKVLLDEYLVKSLPNRMSISSNGTIVGKAAFTSYSFSKIRLKPPKKADLAIMPGVNEVDTLVRLLANVSSGGTDKMFVAAEAEYIIAGSRSEIMNQAVVFMNLYLMRMILNLKAVFANAEVQAISTSAAALTFGVGEPVVKAFYFLVEPLLDTIFLVNGKAIPLYKTSAFLTPSGLKAFLTNITSLKIANQDELKQVAKDQFGEDVGVKDKFAGKVGKLNWKYDKYLFLQMLLFGQSDLYLKRLRSLINIEANAHYKTTDFTLQKSYTGIRGSVNGTYNPVLPIGALAEGGMFPLNQAREDIDKTGKEPCRFGPDKFFYHHRPAPARRTERKNEHMGTFSFENQGTSTFLVCSLTGENIDTVSLGMLTNNKIPGLAPALFTRQDTEMRIKYNVSSHISLRQFFSGEVSRKRLLGAFLGIAEAFCSAEDYMLDLNSILLDPDYIFADVSSCSARLICVPVQDAPGRERDYGAFFKRILFSAQFD